MPLFVDFCEKSSMHKKQLNFKAEKEPAAIDHTAVVSASLTPLCLRVSHT